MYNKYQKITIILKESFPSWGSRVRISFAAHSKSSTYRVIPVSAFLLGHTNRKKFTNKGLDTELLKSFILRHIDIHGYATRKEIDELLMDKMPDYLDEEQLKIRPYQ